MNDTYIVYIQIDTNGNIIAVNSSAFTDNNWGIKIDEGQGDKYHHCQGNYFEKPIMTSKSLYRYKYINGITTEKTEEEIISDEDTLPPTLPTLEDRVKSLESVLLEVILDG